LLALVPHRKLMVGVHNIKVGAVLTHQGSLLGWVRPKALLLWAPVGLFLVRCRLVGIAGRAEFRCATLTAITMVDEGLVFLAVVAQGLILQWFFFLYMEINSHTYMHIFLPHNTPAR
jgi:hypothetical protein